MKPQQLRIIGGQWRSRQISLVNLPALRPTPNRIRETLFNWLRPQIIGAYCLDCFTGSGALSFEALSQGASKVVCLEQEPILIEQLYQNAQSLHAQDLTIIHTDAIKWLNTQPPTPFDIIFLDPPYANNLLIPCLKRLQKRMVKEQSVVYYEHDQPLLGAQIPQPWLIDRAQKAGAVYYYLLRLGSSNTPNIDL